MLGRFVLSLRCRHCGQREDQTLETVYEQLRALGFLRRGGEPSLELTLELARDAIEQGRWGSCPSCGTSGLGITTEADAAEDGSLWNDARHCEECKAIIPAERIEVFPQTKLCSKCQNQVETGSARNDHEYCPYCGEIMQLRAATTPGATYRLYCPSCRKAY